MAEAEDVLQEVAHHAASAAQRLWQRHRAHPPAAGTTELRDVARRLELMLGAVCGRTFPLRTAQPPAPTRLLERLFGTAKTAPRTALPGTDGQRIWLPARFGDSPALSALTLYRLCALRQAVRATRGSVLAWHGLGDHRQRTLFLVLDANALDATLATLLPGLRPALRALRGAALAARPSLARMPGPRDALERALQAALAEPLDALAATSPSDLIVQARRLAAGLPAGAARAPLRPDVWTGEFRPPARGDPSAGSGTGTPPDAERPRSARLARSPAVRTPEPDEDDDKPGAWMVQSGAPQQHVEDPAGLQRPTDRDESDAAEDYADSLSELPEARLVRTPTRPKEILQADDAPDDRGAAAAAAGHGLAAAESDRLWRYPEWDARSQTYRENHVTVRIGIADEGPQRWVRETLEAHRTMLESVRKRFEMLAAVRTRLRRRMQGDDIDLEACVEAMADRCAGLPMPQALYQVHRPARRDLAVLLLIDVSGSTDGWLSADRRIIDVEREALLAVGVALQGLAEPFALQAFSGVGPAGVRMRSIKRFDEPFGDDVARRIAGLEPEQFTRAGAAIRHATATLMRQTASHRLLLLLSDGKPNDVDEYDGPYGVEDMRQAVVEARLQQVDCFCLTVDHQAAGYLPRIFGPHRYGLLPRTHLLPSVLLEWMKRLVAA